MVSLKMGPALLLLALCVAGVLCDQERNAYASRQRRVQVDSNDDDKDRKFSGRIVGGTELEEPLPYLLSLRDSGNHICGASIISAKHALSAAHCQNPPSDVERLTLLAGTVQRTDDASGIVFQVDKVVTHPEFVQKTYLNDVAILRIATSFLDHSGLATIPLASELYNLRVNSVSTVNGWGLTAQDSTLAPTLRTVNIPITSYSKCVAKWRPVRIAKTAICAGHPGRDSCNGDSGGPLVQNGTQIGLVSWGADRCGSDYPGIYTYIGNKDIRKFITENSGV
ncbi:trypsin alpha-3-like [Anopheles marshallii]|uniref:trypsin alpha-3-like n=1 Tax=Anopheles marshallii TaxID=1521116 RepID=UPI00237A8266|nr:trypsin alpha-3-like [Anopheles marshallii]